jgi:hypothetical protein
MAKKFQNLTVDYKKLLNFSVSDRAAMAKSEYGQSLLSSLTPTQYASLFPTYYKDRLPDISGFLAAGRPGVRLGDTRTGYEPSATPVGRVGQPPSTTATGGRTTPSYIRRLKEVSGGIDISDPGAKAQLSSEKKEIFDLLKKGQISADDPRAAFLKDISEADLKKAGIQATAGKDGKQTYQMAPTAASQMTDEEIDKNLRSASGGVSPRERATLDIISKREGSKDPNIIFGDVGGKAGTGKYSKQLKEMGHTKPLTEMSVNEVLAMQADLTKITRGKLKHSPGLGTSAVGSGQMISGTLKANLKAMGIPEKEWGNIKFDQTLQEKLTLQNFKSSGIGDPNADPKTWNLNRLGKQYESLDTSKGYAGLSAAEIAKIQGASGDKSMAAEGGVITPEARAAYRAKLAEQEQSRKEDVLAAASIGKLPAGVDTKFAQEYEKMTPGQKQATLTAIEKTGVDKFNSIYKENPQQTIQTAAAGAPGAVKLFRTASGSGSGSGSDSSRGLKDFGDSQYGAESLSQLTQVGSKVGGTHEITGGGAKGQGSLKGLCGRGSRGVVGALLNDKYFANGLGGNADSLSRGNPYLQKSGMYKAPTSLDKKQMSKEYLDSLPIGTVISSTGGGKGYGHVQVKGPGGTWVSDGVQTKVLTSGYGNFTAHLPNENAIKRMNPKLLGADPATFAYAQSQGYIIPTPSPEQVAQGVPGAPPPSKEEAKENQAKIADATVKKENVDKEELAKAEDLQQEAQAENPVKSNQEKAGAFKLFKTAAATTPAPTAEVKPKESSTTTPIAQQSNRDTAQVKSSEEVKKIAGIVVERNGQKVEISPEDQKKVDMANNLKNSMAQAPKESSTTTPIAQQQMAQSTNEVIPVLADGGAKELNTEEITAYPIGPLKGDNSVVVDDNKKPLFTMNTDKESAHYDPVDKTVSVKPLDEKKTKLDKKPMVGKAIPVLAEGGEVDLQASAQGEPVPKVDSEGLQNPETAEAAEPEASTPNVGAMAQGNAMGPAPATTASIAENLRNMSANPITCPSFGRAIAASNFKKSGDHYDGGATNVK